MSALKFITLEDAGEGEAFVCVMALPQRGRVAVTHYGQRGSAAWYLIADEAREIAAELQRAADEMEAPQPVALAA